MGLFDKFKIGLGKSSDGLSTGFKNIFSKKKIDENFPDYLINNLEKYKNWIQR